MKQSGQLSCVRVDPRNVRALIPIAVDTCQRKVFEFIRAAVLSRNDVVCLEWRAWTKAADSIRNVPQPVHGPAEPFLRPP
jgi:hypothetical protein